MNNRTFENRSVTVVLVALFSCWLCLPSNLLAQTNQPQPASSEATPEAVVTSMEQALLYIMQNEQFNHAGRSMKIQAVVERAFNFSRMGRFLFGSRWRGFTTEQQSGFSDAFSTFTVATYADRFNSFNNEQFIAISAEQPGSNRALVRRQLLTGKGEQIAFDYLLLQEAQQWRIVNITTRGVSDLALKRTQYSKLYNDGELAGVLEYIQQQTERIQTQ